MYASKINVSKMVSKMYISKMVSNVFTTLVCTFLKIFLKNGWCRQNWVASIEMFVFTALFTGSATKPVTVFKIVNINFLSIF